MTLSHLPKLQLHGTARRVAPFGTAMRRDGAWWCPLTRRARARGRRAPGRVGRGAEVVDVTSVFASLTIAGPLARDASPGSARSTCGRR